MGSYGKHGKSGLGSKGVWGVHLLTMIKKQEDHKLRTYIAINISLVNQNVSFQKSKSLQFYNFQELTEGPPKTIILDCGATKLLNLHQELPLGSTLNLYGY